MSKEAEPQAEGCHSHSEITLLGACVNRRLKDLC